MRRQDSPEYATITGRYLGGMLVSAAVMIASAALPDDARRAVWAVVALGWVVGGLALSATAGEPVSLGMGVTDSMVERFGLFTIIVLGEVVVGMVDSLSEVERTVRTVATGVLALMIGFGFWWTYFDFVGGRLPGETAPAWRHSGCTATCPSPADLYRPLSAAMVAGALAAPSRSARRRDRPPVLTTFRAPH